MKAFWEKRGRTLLYWAIVAQLAALLIFIAVLFLGEQSRITLIALYLPRAPFLITTIAAAALARFTKRRVRLLIGVNIVAALLVFFPIMGFHAGSGRSSTHSIKLVSYNIYFGKLGRPQLLDEIAAMPVDVIVLQAGYDSLTERLKEKFPDRHVHQEHELAVVSKFPFTKTTVPPALPDGERPMFMEYVIDTPNGAFRLFNIHPFSPRHALFDDHQTGENIDHREAQVEAVAAAALKDGPPVLIVGDTNLPPLSQIARKNFGRFKDAFEEVGTGFGYTFPAKRPWMRIDRAFAEDGIKFTRAVVAPHGRSDHRAIFVDFEIESGH